MNIPLPVLEELSRSGTWNWSATIGNVNLVREISALHSASDIIYRVVFLPGLARSGHRYL